MANVTPVQSFTPNKDYLSFSGLINEVLTPVTYANAANNTLLITDVLGGLITHTAAGAQTDTLPLPSLLVPAIQGAQVGSSIQFYLKAGGAGTITLGAPAGVTIVGTATVATANIKSFLLVVTALPDIYGNGATYSVYSLGTAAY